MQTQVCIYFIAVWLIKFWLPGSSGDVGSIFSIRSHHYPNLSQALHHPGKQLLRKCRRWLPRKKFVSISKPVILPVLPVELRPSHCPGVRLRRLSPSIHPLTTIGIFICNENSLPGLIRFLFFLRRNHLWHTTLFRPGVQRQSVRAVQKRRFFDDLFYFYKCHIPYLIFYWSLKLFFRFFPHPQTAYLHKPIRRSRMFCSILPDNFMPM